MKILIVTEKFAGRGHEKAAYAIAKAMKQMQPSYQIKVIPLLSVINKPLEKTLQLVYMTLITKAPSVWGWLHKKEGSFSLLKHGIAYGMMFKLKDMIEKEQPKLIIATHASGLGALSLLKRKYHYQLVAAFTDFQVNSFWVHEEIDGYFVAHHDLQQKLIKTYHVASNKVYVTGIPIDPDFAKTFFSDKALQKKTKGFQVLLMGGGFGLGGMREIIFALEQIKDFPIVVHAVTGTNRKLYDDLSALQNRINLSLHIYGYVEHIHHLMKRADLLITKSGGLTVSEALAIPIPMIIYKPIPGQEERNADFLIRNKAAIRVNEVKYIPYWVRYLYHHPHVHQRLAQREKVLGRPFSSLQIGEILLQQASDHEKRLSNLSD